MDHCGGLPGVETGSNGGNTAQRRERTKGENTVYSSNLLGHCFLHCWLLVGSLSMFELFFSFHPTGDEEVIMILDSY